MEYPDVIEQDVFGGREKAASGVVGLCVTAISTPRPEVVIVKAGEHGYSPTGWYFNTVEDAREYAKEYNGKLGVSETEAYEMVLLSMRE